MSNISTSNLDRALSLKEMIEKSFILMAELLVKINDAEEWRGRYDSWQEFLEELGMKTWTASKLMTVYRHYILDLRCRNEDIVKVRSWESLYDARGKATDAASAAVVISNAATMSTRDVRRWAGDEQDCEHHNQVKLLHCTECGRNVRIDENEG